MFDQKSAKPDLTGRVWFVWRVMHGGVCSPAIYYGALPESHEGKRGWIRSPVELTGDDKHLSLIEAAAKFPLEESKNVKR